MAQDTLLKKLNKIRKEILPNFAKIKLTPEAVNITSKLFLHPFCISTRNLTEFIRKKPIKLSALSQHIITAFPNTISFYSKKHHKILIDYQDILECFATDHIEGIEENKIEKVYSPSYALAHILTLCKITALRKQGRDILGDLEYKLGNQTIFFHNVFVPSDLKVKKRQKVFHHFGVVVDSERNEKLALLIKKLKNEQRKIGYLYKISKGNKRIIDFGKPGLYDFDLLKYIIRESQKPGQQLVFHNLNLNKNQKVPFNC